MIEFVTNENIAAYDAFVEAHPKGHFMQSSMWAKQKPDWKWEGILSKDSNGYIRGAMSVLIRKVPYLKYTLMYAGRGDEDEIEAILNRYSKGQVISVKGFISQKSVDVEPTEDSKFNSKYKNTYYITTFLTGDTDADFDEMI